MNFRAVLLITTLVVFGGFSFWALIEEGYFGIWQAGFTSPGSMQILFDLAIACFVFASWMIGDARSRGVNPVPWIVAILATGSIAILLYLLTREFQKSPQIQTP